ncbi:MAG TPA: hypothetical protein VK509_23900 [Polyangiales bacterium]|nr:hypothetical protein [Polyangiales bacterium]
MGGGRASKPGAWLACVALIAFSFGCEPRAGEELPALPVDAGWTQLAGSGDALLAANEHAVYALDRQGALQVARSQGDAPLAVELAADGAHYGVYRADGFELHDRAGARLAMLAPARLGFRHKLIGGGRVLAPLIEQRGPEDGRMVGIELRDVRGALQATIAAPDGVRFTRASADAITFAGASRVARHAFDGRELWSVPLAAQELAVAAERDRVAVVSAEDARRLVLFADGRRIGTADLRAPIWNVALSPSGEHAAVTTQRSLHAFASGRLQLNQRLPLAYAVSLAVARDGRMLVGGQDERGRGRALCYAPSGELLAELTLAAEQQAFKPAVRWLDAERVVALGSAGPVYGRCPREVAP